MYARHERKPLWQLIAEFTPEEFVRATAFRYITDAITPDEALELLRAKEKGKKERLERVKKEGYPSYTTSVVSDRSLAKDERRRATADVRRCC